MTTTLQDITSTTGEQADTGPRVWRVDIPGVTGRDLFPIRWQFYLSVVGLGLGVAQGLIQALERANVRLYNELPLSQSYYQGLTLHGVALAFIFTFTFANGFLPLMAMKGFGGPLASRTLSNLSLYCAWGGVALATWAILGNKATVLFTFYAPLEPNPSFYIGAVLLVISTWLIVLNLVLSTRQWRKAHVGERLPLPSFMSLTTGLMWFLASLGVAIEILGFLLPWSFGWIDGVDPQFTRLLFWFTGHPIVYFWLLPAYMCWYLLLPRLAGNGKLYSDGLARLVFLAFLVLLPVGVHHQFTDPGIEMSSKSVMWILTFLLFMPSVITAFTVIAALEQAGRNNGGKGLFGWIWKLKWGDPAVAGMLLAGLAFFLGGMSGLVNSSFTINLVVHNTSFIPGHFHLTVGTAVALTIMAIWYYLIPYVTGKELWGRKLGVWQVWLWFIGVLLFSRGQMESGIFGQPRRTQISEAVYYQSADSSALQPFRDALGRDVESLRSGWKGWNYLTAIGGSVMFVSGMLFLLIVVVTLVRKRSVTTVQRLEITECTHGAHETHALLDRVGTWALVAVVLSILVYGEAILHYWPLNPVSNPIQVW